MSRISSSVAPSKTGVATEMPFLRRLTKPRISSSEAPSMNRPNSSEP